jgi:type IV pilus assembly protein PilM
MAEKPAFEPYIAVDVGSFSLKFAYITPGEGGKPRLKALAHLPIPPFTHLLTTDEREKMSREDVEKDSIVKLQKFLTKHLTELLYDNQIQTKKAVTLASGRPVTIRYFEIPPVPEKEALTGAVNAEAAKQMPFSMENAVLGYTVLGDTTKEDKALQQIMVAALQKDIVAVISENLKGGGLTNDGILALPQALELGVPQQLGIGINKESKVGVIHCGHKTTSIMIYKNGRLNFYRDINMAGETITEAIFQGGEVDGTKIEFTKVEEAVELKHKIGVLPPDEIKNLQGPERFAGNQIFSTVEKIFQHIQLSISFYISQTGESGVEKLVLSGGSAAMKNFKEFIQESLEVPVELANPFENLAISEINIPKEKMEQEAPAFAPAIGLAIYNDQNVINFIEILFPNRRKQSLDFGNVSSKFSAGIGAKLNIQLDEKKIKILAGLLGVLIVVALAFPLVKIRQDVKKAQENYKKLQNSMNELTSTQNDVTVLLADKERLGKEALFVDELRNLQFPLSEMLLELTKMTPRQVFIIRMELNHTETTRTFRIHGHTDTSDRVFEYIKAFNESPFFKTPNLDSTEEVSIDEQRYFMKFIVSGQIVAPPPPTPPSEEGGDSDG